MMAHTGWLGGHPEAGELLCFADRSLSAVEHGQLAAHITECEHCQRELSILDAQARSVSAAMATLGSHAVSDIRKAGALAAVRAAARKVDRRRNLRVVWMPRLAAASLVLAAGMVLAGPAVAAFIRNVFVKPEPPVVAPSIVVAPEKPGIALPSKTEFEYDRASFVLSFENIGGGTLEFRRTDTKFLAIEMTGSPNITSGPAGPSIKNDSTGSPVFIVTLPTLVTEVTVSVGGRRPVHLIPETGKLYDVKGLAEGREIKSDPKKK